MDAPAHSEKHLTSRLYQTEPDLQDMLQLLMLGRSQTDDWHYPHVGDLLFGFLNIACHLNPQEHIRLWHQEKQLLGYATLAEDPAFDFAVLPGYEGCGIEEEAIQWAQTCVAEFRRKGVEGLIGPLISGARQDNPGRITFLEKHGFKPGGEFSEVNMICHLDAPIPQASAPAPFVIRSLADEAEIPARAEVHRQVWHPWTVGNITDEDYALFTRLPGYQRDLDIFAISPKGEIASYVNAWIDPLNKVGDFGPLGAHPAYRRLGLTRAVLCEALRRLKAHGMQRVSVSTGEANIAAIRLYESAGFRIVNRYQEFIQADQL